MTTLIEKIQAEIDRAAKEYHKSGFVKSSHVHEANSFYDGAQFLLPLLKKLLLDRDNHIRVNYEYYGGGDDVIQMRDDELLKLIGCEHE